MLNYTKNLITLNPLLYKYSYKINKSKAELYLTSILNKSKVHLILVGNYLTNHPKFILTSYNYINLLGLRKTSNKRLNSKAKSCLRKTEMFSKFKRLAKRKRKLYKKPNVQFKFQIK